MASLYFAENAEVTLTEIQNQRMAAIIQSKVKPIKQLFGFQTQAMTAKQRF